MSGGLGNQLFQYATARSLSLDKNSDFLMNLSFYNREYVKNLAHVDFKLNHFNVDFNKQIEEGDINKYDNVQKIVEPLSSQNFSEFIDFSKYAGNIHLIGFWQNEKYFKHNQEIIKKELQVITPPNKKNQKLLDEISESNAICISFRRGDYLDPIYLANFGIELTVDRRTVSNEYLSVDADGAWKDRQMDTWVYSVKTSFEDMMINDDGSVK